MGIVNKPNGHSGLVVQALVLNSQTGTPLLFHGRFRAHSHFFYALDGNTDIVFPAKGPEVEDFLGENATRCPKSCRIPEKTPWTTGQVSGLHGTAFAARARRQSGHLDSSPPRRQSPRPARALLLRWPRSPPVRASSPFPSRSRLRDQTLWNPKRFQSSRRNRLAVLRLTSAKWTCSSSSNWNRTQSSTESRLRSQRRKSSLSSILGG